MKKTLLFTVLALLGMTQTVAQEYEYVPFVREGVKWVYCYDSPIMALGYEDGFIPFGIHYYTFEMKGDTVIDGKSYKPVHLYSGNGINEANDTIPVYLREENKVVYGIIPDDKRYYECPIGIGTMVLGYNYVSPGLETGIEFVLYDFNNIETFYSSLAFSDYNDNDTVQIGNHLSKRYIFNIFNDNKDYIIEGLGFVEGCGMPLNYFYGLTTGVNQVMYWLSHVIEDGEIIYKGMGYSDDALVGIDEVVADRTRRPADPNYYNLMGQPVGQDVPTAPGIYIHQGKKVVVR